jgi:hypothetical protein
MDLSYRKAHNLRTIDPSQASAIFSIRDSIGRAETIKPQFNARFDLPY